MCCEAAEWDRVSEGPIYSAAMSPLLLPLQMLLLMFAGWVNRHQLDVIEYLQEENRVLKERMGGRRLRFTDAERRRLARKAQALGRKVLNELETLVTPDTLLRWYRITQYMSHYHQERNHQGLENRLLRPLRAVGEFHARVKRRQRLGGMLSYYYREAA
jgi:hypothetical protein